MRETALSVMGLPAFWLLDLLDMIVTPVNIEVVLEALRCRNSLLETVLSESLLAGHDMQSVHARSPSSLATCSEFFCYTVGPGIIHLYLKLLF